MAKVKCYVLDACALLRLAQDEPGADKIARLMVDATAEKCRLLMHIVNLGEVVYLIAKRFGWEVALRKRAEINLLPVTVVGFAEALFWEAVKLKAAYPMSYADCFAAALALREKAWLLTSDPEFPALGDALQRIKV